jgi:hypothetical protein
VGSGQSAVAVGGGGEQSELFSIHHFPFHICHFRPAQKLIDHELMETDK